MNEIIFLLHIIFIMACSLIALRMGKETLVSLICFQGVLSNLLVTKQITLFGFDVTSSDMFSVGLVLGLNLLQEYFGHTLARRTIWINFSLLLFYVIMTQLHLIYTPNHFDTMHPHFEQLFSLMPRITISSLSVYCFVQHLDAALYKFLKQTFKGKYLFFRNLITLSVSQFIDTVLFTLLALYGVVGSVWSVITVSFAIKIIVIAFATPFVSLSRKFVPRREKGIPENYEHL